MNEDRVPETSITPYQPETIDPALAQTRIQRPAAASYVDGTRSVWPVLLIFGLTWLACAALSVPLLRDAHSVPAAQSAAPASVQGWWTGSFDHQPAALRIHQDADGELSGSLVVSYPDQIFVMDVDGEVVGDQVILNETSAHDADGYTVNDWALGVDTGAASRDGLQMVGAGADEDGQEYQWSFRRAGF